MSTAAASIMGLLTLVLVFWNPRGILNKEVEFKTFLNDQGAAYAGVSESQTYKDGANLTDERYAWEAGTEGCPSERGAGPSRGMGAFVDKRKAEASLIRTDKYAVWHRLSVPEGDDPLVVGVGYFPNAQDVRGHEEANAELSVALAYFREQGLRVIFGGDLNAHIGANGDLTPPDRAGRILLETVEFSDMMLVNTMPGKCIGGPSRVQVREDGTQSSTVDYVMCSPSLAPHVKSLVISEDQNGSDHCPLVLTLENCMLKQPPQSPTMREVWNVRDIPSPPNDWSWVRSCQASFGKWVGHTEHFLRAVAVSGAEASHLANMLDWSFQQALDELAAEHLGTRWAGPKTAKVLDAAAQMAIHQRELTQDVLKWAMHNSATPEHARREARSQFLAASREVTAVAARRRELAELRLFRDVESKESNSKLFWGKFKALKSSIFVSKSPPPVAVDSTGETATDPVAVLRAWRDFSAGLASSDLTGTREEGRYDDEYKEEVEADLRWLKRVREYQPQLDFPVTGREVFAAIRKLRIGSAPGEDGILPDIIKTAADAVNNSKLRGNNTVVNALVLLYNYVFDNEVWPERWSSGLIVPLHKHGSKLDPANYRPITLLSVLGKLFGSVVNARLQAFSEATGSISDEQGGFRRNRGTNDQIFIFREILASRKERGLATYATYIDARKAYDTVWREQAYLRIHDGGVRGKLWRQLQVMHGNLNRTVLHPLGHTPRFPVERGVAQGAVESPWVYSSFIDALARKLKAAGLGIWMAGEQVPILMYADDMVMLARSQAELVRMNEIASVFAKQNRFEFNGEKSGVMAFNVSKADRALCAARRWVLFDEPVEVVPEYVYLGTAIPLNGICWKAHVDSAIVKAKRRSADLLWVCRVDKGMRPRTAVTLWKSLVRPILEYACELWDEHASITQEQQEKVERVQMTFLRGTLGLHANGSGAANEAVRAELGCELLRDRRLKLKLGYWRRLFVAQPNRLLRKVAEFRWAERSGAGGYGSRGWMPTAEAAFTRSGLQRFWQTPADAAALPVPEWRARTYEAVEARSDDERSVRMANMTSTQTYTSVKHWGINTPEYSFSSGEEGRLGQLVPEQYLDDRSDLKGTRLKLLCRLGCLPVMNRVGREVRPKWPKETRICLACDNGQLEDVEHFIMDCPMYDAHRQRMLAQVDSALGQSPAALQLEDFSGMDDNKRLTILLGKRIGDPVAEDRIDRTVKRYLRKAWNARSPVTEAINRHLGTKYEVQKGKVQHRRGGACGGSPG
jgi:hypothetical protein